MSILVTVQQATILALVVVGSFFLTAGTIGLLRLPNVYNRLHATSKPTTLGTASMFLAGFVKFGPGGAGLTSLVGIGFLFLTVPTGAHMISRAAQKTGVPFLSGVTWPRVADEAETVVEQPGVLDGRRVGTSADEMGGDVETDGTVFGDAEEVGAVGEVSTTGGAESDQTSDDEGSGDAGGETGPDSDETSEEHTDDDDGDGQDSDEPDGEHTDDTADS